MTSSNNNNQLVTQKSSSASKKNLPNTRFTKYHSKLFKVTIFFFKKKKKVCLNIKGNLFYLSFKINYKIEVIFKGMPSIVEAYAKRQERLKKNIDVSERIKVIFL